MDYASKEKVVSEVLGRCISNHKSLQLGALWRESPEDTGEEGAIRRKNSGWEDRITLT